MTATTLPTLNHHAAADELMNVFADGLDASVDGRGFGAEHLAARNAIVKAFADREELVKALAAALDSMDRQYPRGLPITRGTACEETDWNSAVRKGKAALARATA